MIKTHMNTERYQRQLMLPQLGTAGQEKLANARVLVIGAGGLGCPVLQYLVAAGIGTLGIIDDDVVQLSNLHRQVLFDMTQLGQLKVEAAAGKLRQMNPDIRVISYPERLSNNNALDLFTQFDIIVDASDNFPTRYLVNDACVLTNKPLVYGAVSRFEGQVAVWNVPKAAGGNTSNYRDLFPEAPKDGLIDNCAASGIIGVLPGIIGSIQAGEVIKLATGLGTGLSDRLQTFNWLTNEWFTYEITPLKEASLVPDRLAFTTHHYELSKSEPAYQEIDTTVFNIMLQEEAITIIDVREAGEQPLVHEFEHLQIPLAQLTEHQTTLPQGKIVFFCGSGQRSARAAEWTAKTLNAQKIYSLKGGIAAFKQANKNHHGQEQ